MKKQVNKNHRLIVKRNRLLFGHSWWGRLLHTAMALHVGANLYTGPAYSAKVCFMVVGYITTIVNKGRQVRPTSQYIALDVSGKNPT